MIKLIELRYGLADLKITLREKDLPLLDFATDLMTNEVSKLLSEQPKKKL